MYSHHRLSASVAWETADQLAYCLDGQVYSAGSAVDWLVRIGLLSSSRELDTVGRDFRSSSSVTCVPSFAGLGAPLWEPRAGAHFEGIDLSTTSGDIVWSVLDGIACQVAAVVAASESDVGVPLEVLRVDGGLSASQLLMQHQADVLQRPVEVFVSPHATALGVVELVRRGARLAPLAVDELAIGQRFEPRMAVSESLGRRERWNAAAARAAAAAHTGVR
jgi:glycerol kinase